MNRQDYIRLNNSFGHAVTFTWERLGFYSNFNNMVLTMAYCLKHRLRFRLYCKDYELLSNTGWEDMFLPLDCETKNSFFAHFNFRRKLVENNSLNDRLHLLVNSLYPILTGNNLANAVFAESRTCWFLKETFDIPELGFKGGLRELCRELVGVAYQFNDSYRNRIDDYKKKAVLPPRCNMSVFTYGEATKIQSARKRPSQPIWMRRQRTQSCVMPLC